jgi:hypothetical protein
MGKESPRGAAPKARTRYENGQPRGSGIGASDAPAAVVKSGLAGAMKEGPERGSGFGEYKIGTKRKYLYGKTKKAVTDKLKERLSSGGMNLAPEADTMLVGAYLDRWLPTVRGTVKERTWR